VTPLPTMQYFFFDLESPLYSSITNRGGNLLACPTASKSPNPSFLRRSSSKIVHLTPFIDFATSAMP